MSYSKSAPITTVPSRFAALKIEDDDDFIETKPKKGNSKSSNNNNNSSSNKQAKKKNKNNQGSNITVDDWSNWKQKDEEFTDQLYMEQLKQAMIESKVQYEDQKISTKPESQAKQNKAKPMSLEEFHKLGDNQTSKLKKPQVESRIDINSDIVLKEIDENVKKTIQMENSKILEFKPQEGTIDKFLNLQYKEEVQKRDREIERLVIEITRIKDEVIEVRKRNKQLAFIMAQGEMKEKAELLYQIDELTATKDDLTQQIQILNTNLEQEKSKVHHLENELKKSKKH